MQQGLQGRRIAFASGNASDGAGGEIATALEGAGAQVDRLTSSGGEESWHGARYAALVVLGADQNPDPKLVQLVREFLVADKPLVAVGEAVRTVFAAGGVEGRRVVAPNALRAEIERAGATCLDADVYSDEALITARDGVDPHELATKLVGILSRNLDDRAVDEMSDMSFPASDPPAVTPASVGRVARDGDVDARP